MYKLKKGKFYLIGSTVILVVVFFLFINSKVGISAEQPTISPDVQTENEKKIMEINNFLFGNSGIIKQVNDELMSKGYLFQTLIAAHSVDEVQVKYVLTNKEATIFEQEAVESIFFEIVKENNLEPNAFKLKVSDSDDGPDW